MDIDGASDGDAAAYLALGSKLMDDYPQKKRGDYAHETTKAALNIIPVVGGAVASVFETVFSAPIDKRKQEWLKRLADTVQALCDKIEGLTPERLAKNEAFVSVYLQASNVAIRTHHKEKLDALNAAVMNTVLLEEYDESKRAIFVRLIEQLTPLHIRALRFLAHPDFYLNELKSREPPNVSCHYGGLTNVWNKYYDGIRSQDPLMNIVITDLNLNGLIFVKSFSDTGSSSSVATKLGMEFLKFISPEQVD